MTTFWYKCLKCSAILQEEEKDGHRCKKGVAQK